MLGSMVTSRGEILVRMEPLGILDMGINFEEVVKLIVLVILLEV
jgi:hypothetical protein